MTERAKILPTQTGPFYGTFLEHWPSTIAKRSMPHLGYALGPEDARLLEAMEPLDNPQQIGEYSPALYQFLADAIGRFEEGIFLRLGGRSFVTDRRGPRRVRSVENAIQILRQPGYRAARMAHRCRMAGRPVWLFARQWLTINPQEEFRLFIQGRRLIGASQYHHALVFPELESKAEIIGRTIASFAAELSRHLHLPDVVADIQVPIDGKGDPLLIELNPFMACTGLALFSNSNDCLSGDFRFLASDGALVGLRIASSGNTPTSGIRCGVVFG